MGRNFDFYGAWEIYWYERSRYSTPGSGWAGVLMVLTPQILEFIVEVLRRVREFASVSCPTCPLIRHGERAEGALDVLFLDLIRKIYTAPGFRFLHLSLSSIHHQLKYLRYFYPNTIFHDLHCLTSIDNLHI